jgi:hypothetical protein
MSGVLEASFLLCCDDLIRNSEEARNPDRVRNAVQKYVEDISQRRANSGVRELHISTRWAVSDVIGMLEQHHADNPKWRFRRIPALDENGESNFHYRARELTTEHFTQIKQRMFMLEANDISFNMIYQQEPQDREGIVFSQGSLKFYDELPGGTPDMICACADIALGGNDYFSMPVAYVYDRDVYIADVIHVNRQMGTKEKTRPRVVEAIVNHKIGYAHFEANNGGDFYAEDIESMLRQRGYRCVITTARVPTDKTKDHRILAAIPEIMGTDADGYRILFRKTGSGHEYDTFLRHITSYNSKRIGKQPDDAPDALAALINRYFGTRRQARIEAFDRAAMGL